MFKSVWNFFKKLFGSAPEWTKRVSNFITLVAPLVNTVIVLTAGGDTKVQAIVNEVQADLKLISSLVEAGKTGDPEAAAKVVAALNAVLSNLALLLKAGHIKNEETTQKINVAATALIGEINAIITVLSQK